MPENSMKRTCAAYIHTYIHTSIHPDLHYMHTCVHAYMHTRIHAYIHACIHIYIFTYIQPHHTIPGYVHAHMHASIYVAPTMCPYPSAALWSLSDDRNLTSSPRLPKLSQGSIEEVSGKMVRGFREDGKFWESANALNCFLNSVNKLSELSQGSLESLGSPQHRIEPK